MAAMGRPPWTIDETRARVRLSLRESFPLHFGDRWEEAREIYLDCFRAIHLERLAALPGREELLRGLAAEDIFLGIVSNKTGALLRREAEQLGWSRLISVGWWAPATRSPTSPTPLRSAWRWSRAGSRQVRLCGSSATLESTWNAPSTAVACRFCSAANRHPKNCWNTRRD